MQELLCHNLAPSFPSQPNAANLSAWRADPTKLLPGVLLACFAFLYLQVFILPDTPRAASGDQSIYLHHGTRMFEGQLIYRDYDHFTTPGTDVFYAALFKLFGVRVWIPQAMLVLLGTTLAWLSIVIARRIIAGPAVFLPAFMFLSLAYSGYLDATHHWYSTLAATAALAVVIDERSEYRLLWAGFFLGLGVFFTQSLAIGVLGFALFLLWEKYHRDEKWRVLLKKESALWVSFLGTVVATDGYFIWRVGIRRFFYFTVTFPFKYYPADYFNNWRVYMRGWPSIHSPANWPDVLAFAFIHLLVPLIYALFLARWWRERQQREEPWDKLMLVTLTGFSLLVSVAPAPAYTRLYAVSIPALVLLVWFLNPKYRAEKILLWVAWATVVVLAIARPLIAQTRWKAFLDLPTGRTAFIEPVSYEKCKWLSLRTHPSDYFFGDHFSAFALRLHNVGRVPFLRPTDYTRPEEVQDAMQALERHQVRFVSWYSGLDHETEAVLHPESDHLGPMRTYLGEHYHVVKVFSNGDLIWERNQ